MTASLTTKIFGACLRPAVLVASLFLLGACVAHEPQSQLEPTPVVSKLEIDPARTQMALLEAKDKRSKGQRVWCVPFARTVSGVEIKGNAKTWWKSAAGQYERGQKPKVGAVMAFAGTRKMPLGHVAVVSEVISEREVKINHANWQRNKVQLGMRVLDVSAKGDWSAVRVERSKGSMGTGNYPLNGFIYPN